MQEIKAWLNSNQDFDIGAKLYQQFGTNAFFKNLLKAGKTPFNLQQLPKKLAELLPEEIPAQKPEKPKPAAKEKELPTPNLSDHVKKLELDDYVKKLYKQLNLNRAILIQSDKESILFATAKQIKKIRKEISKTWTFIDFYNENGFLPDAAKDQKKHSPEEKIQLLRQSISKAKARLKKPNCKNREATEKLIEENIKQILALGGSVKC